MLAPIDAPVGETLERYRLVLTSAAGNREYSVAQPTFTLTAGELAGMGSGAMVIEVQQVGDFAASRPARLTIVP